MVISPQRLTIYLYSTHRAVIFAIAQLSCCCCCCCCCCWWWWFAVADASIEHNLWILCNINNKKDEMWWSQWLSWLPVTGINHCHSNHCMVVCIQLITACDDFIMVNDVDDMVTRTSPHLAKVSLQQAHLRSNHNNTPGQGESTTSTPEIQSQQYTLQDQTTPGQGESTTSIPARNWEMSISISSNERLWYRWKHQGNKKLNSFKKDANA